MLMVRRNIEWGCLVGSGKNKCSYGPYIVCINFNVVLISSL